jgi:hypothetical protein
MFSIQGLRISPPLCGPSSGIVLRQNCIFTHRNIEVLAERRREFSTDPIHDSSFLDMYDLPSMISAGYWQLW